MDQVDLFGEKRVFIQDNPTLQKVAEMILRLSDHYPEMFDGNTIGAVNRKVREIVWMENGLYEVLKEPDFQKRLDAFENWHKDNKRCIDTELITRATRFLVAEGTVRLRKSAIIDGERHKNRLTKAFSKR